MPTSCHVAVLESEVVEYLAAEKGGEFLDCTLGGGGHTRAILDRNPQSSLIAIDRDRRAIERATTWSARYQGRFETQHGSFGDLPQFFKTQRFDGILADLGLSSDQLAEERGFSFDDDAQLDMRMDETQELKAQDLIETLSQKELVKLLCQGGAEQEAFIAAKAIVQHRPFASARELARALNKALLPKFGKRRAQPATVVFQALRIAVNQELQQLESFLESVPQLIKQNGRLVVIAFHSLEDRIVTRRMRQWANVEFSAASPDAHTQKPLGQLLTKKAVCAGERELSLNPRARSARLRAFQFN